MILVIPLESLLNLSLRFVWVHLVNRVVDVYPKTLW